MGSIQPLHTSHLAPRTSHLAWAGARADPPPCVCVCAVAMPVVPRRPVVDGAASGVVARPLEQARAGTLADVPIMMGTVRDEGSLFCPVAPWLAGVLYVSRRATLPPCRLAALPLCRLASVPLCHLAVRVLPRCLVASVVVGPCSWLLAHLHNLPTRQTSRLCAAPTIASVLWATPLRMCSFRYPHVSFFPRTRRTLCTCLHNLHTSPPCSRVPNIRYPLSWIGFERLVRHFWPSGLADEVAKLYPSRGR